VREKDPKIQSQNLSKFLLRNHSHTADMRIV